MTKETAGLPGYQLYVLTARAGLLHEFRESFLVTLRYIFELGRRSAVLGIISAKLILMMFLGRITMGNIILSVRVRPLNKVNLLPVF